MKKKYVAALRRQSPVVPEQDWAGGLASIEGVELLGVTGRYAQFLAEESALERVRAELGSSCHIEEQVDRKPN